MKEGAIVKACMEYLNLRGAFCWRNQTGMIRLNDEKYGQRFIRQGVKGGADIIGTMPGGKFLAVECKKPLGPKGGTGGSVQTDDQKEFQRRVESLGGLYVVARSTHDLDHLFC